MKYLRFAILALAILGVMPSVVYPLGINFEWVSLSFKVEELWRAGKYYRAVVVAQKALQVAEQNVGPNHPNVAASLNKLAELYLRRVQDYSKAELLYKRSLTIFEKALGPNHHSVATSLENLAALYRTTKRHAQAEKLEQRAAKIRAMKR